MKKFDVRISNCSDIARCLQVTLGSMDTLKAQWSDWDDLMQAVGVTPWNPQKVFHAKVTSDAAMAILKRAVPKVNARDQRAEFNLARDRGISFVTPRGVHILIDVPANENRVVYLTVDFGRDSINLAAVLLANLLPFTPEAAPLLLHVAQQAKAEQQKK